ncbi:hypothetical protein [Nostoc piscinale]|uniref:hypothetical protein n=1 Tax=Nostoc piscinale TaxID=224012 RepID=UPI0011874DF9|nr:hypothetical protein [Nostoc piscinale]
MSESEDIHEISTQGESFSTELSFKWINPTPIEAGELIAPARLSSEAARIFAALHLILKDLTFAEECWKAADDIGIPDNKNLHSKALIFSGVVGYARCFKSGVRALKLTPTYLYNKGVPFDNEIHDYLIALRDKHVAHSVNDFEQCEAVAIVIGKPDTGWRDGSGIGVVKQRSVGISRTLVQRAISHINSLCQFLETELSAQRVAIYAEFKANFEKTGKWEMTPIIKLSDRSKITERRS